MFSFAQYDRFQRNVARGFPNRWHCRGRGTLPLHLRGRAGALLLAAARAARRFRSNSMAAEDLRREGAREKSCAPFCTVSCVHQTAMLDSFRANPREVLREMIAARREWNPGYRPPALLNVLSWTFLNGPASRLFGALALRLLRARS